MGNKNTSVAQSQKTISEDYIQCYKNCQNDENYLYKLLNNHPLATSIVNIFPQYLQSYQHFVEMIQYLTQYEPQINFSKAARTNSYKSSLLDRFFMLCLNISHVDKFRTLQLGIQELQDLLVDYMRLFLSQPRKGCLLKMLKLLKKDTKQKIPLKQFSDAFREQFPHVQKFLREYYNLKFISCSIDQLLISDIKSKIINQDAIFLALKVPKLITEKVTLLYDMRASGSAFHCLTRKIIGYTGPWLLLIQHQQKDQNGKVIRYVLGSYQQGPIKDVNDASQGNLKGFLFSIEPKIQFFTTDLGQEGSNYFYLNTVNIVKSKMRRGLGFGGTNNRQHFKLWIDEDVEKSSIYNQRDSTYGDGCLAGLATKNLNIVQMQVWGLGHESHLQQQSKYWALRDQEIQKMRKVNKADLVKDSPQLIFEKTFQHREHIQGEMQKLKINEQEQYRKSQLEKK